LIRFEGQRLFIIGSARCFERDAGIDDFEVVAFPVSPPEAAANEGP